MSLSPNSGLIDFEEHSFGLFDLFRDHSAFPSIDIVRDFGIEHKILGELVCREQLGEFLEDSQFHAAESTDVDQCVLRGEEFAELVEIFAEPILDIDLLALGWGYVA